ncbi:serine/threonine-protein kinase 16 isoform X2 [Harpegnathos saltator]|uniref:non-specific serine/threonine protein kinase n=2 Tax=Harpegnathos saltator TaxID=610380 RepID=E2BL64_HARSA|nr:serine/threonine-protein kinase 16 isoform X2 [Harpegnathos saltator]XP_011140915.1 serine/threonine-protein kinase 16 isoform X2 [Harpegnathos saltator]XP_025153114.1 serine/threonine-protein kinase 16 isoform X2 [Harpegnathos saltator]EFN83550.1 Serine/threonine-protein kinase 16 [Harpegnathos saltator]
MGCICAKETVTVNSRKYTIREHLGEGGFSTVFLAEDTATHKKYAIKKIICHGPEDQQLAMKEVEYYKQIKHPNVIKCIDSAREGAADPIVNTTSEVLIVLPYYHRGTLADELEQRAKNNDYMSPVDILNIFLQICEGVKAFHEAKPEPLAHRDLKTANIVLSDDGTPVIMDLGSVTTARVQVCGTQAARTLQDLAAERCSMPYRAPELFNVESYCMVDERTDIWSLGCTLYALCYFKSPFDTVYERGDSVALAVISAHVTFPEGAPYNEDMQSLILSMLKVNSMERPYIYSVIENIHDAIAKLESRA